MKGQIIKSRKDMKENYKTYPLPENLQNYVGHLGRLDFDYIHRLEDLRPGKIAFKQLIKVRFKAWL